MNIPDFLKTNKNINLNKQQIDAIHSTDADMLLLAVPGSGKTTVLVSRIANLIINHNINYKNILTLTFSKEAANDMKKRYISLFYDINSNIPHFSTIHSFCYNILKIYSSLTKNPIPSNIDLIGYEKKNVLSQIFLSVNNKIIPEDEYDKLISDISFVNNSLLSTTQLESYSTEIKSFKEIFYKYKEYKKNNKYIDFDDMINHAYTILYKYKDICNYIKNKYRYINIDESQDTSISQHNIIKIIKNELSLFMVGDEDQTIYSFRGTSPEFMINFQKNYPNGIVKKMEENFRSNLDIISSANNIIKTNQKRFKKNITTSNKQKNSINIIDIKDFSEQYKNILKIVQQNKNQIIGILYKHNESAIPLIDLFFHNNIEYYSKQINISFFKSFIVKDILSFFRLSIDLNNIEAFKQIQYKMYISNDIMIKATSDLSDLSIFDKILSLKGIKPYILKKVEIFKMNLPKLKLKSPFDGINFIESTLSYKLFLEKKIKNGYSAENIMTKISILKTIASNYKSIYDFLDRMEQIKNHININNYPENKTIQLMTIHSSKGLEFDHVIILDMIDGQFPSQNSLEEKSCGNIDYYEEEVRLFYVGITRAKFKLTIFHSNYINYQKIKPSRFIDIMLNKKNENIIINNKNISNDLYNDDIIGKKVYHKIYGEGFITLKEYDNITIKFEFVGIKILSLQYSLQNNLIHIDK